MRCEYCGKELKEGSKFCDGCGAKVKETSAVNQNTFNYQNGVPEKKNNTGLIVAIIIIGVLLVAGIIIGVVLLTGGSKKEESKENKEDNGIVEKEDNDVVEKEEDDSKLSSNIKYTEHKLDNGEIILIVTNNNKDDVAIKFDLTYYDEKGTVVDSQDGYLFGLAPNHESVISFYGTDKSFDNYKITYQTLDSDSFISHQKNIEITSNDDKENEEISITAINNSSKELSELSVGVVFYKNGKIVGFDYDNEYDVESGKSVSLYIDYPYDSSYDTINFDNYKVYVLEAYEENYDY